jgi:iron complex outermembrane receptor protein
MSEKTGQSVPGDMAMHKTLSDQVQPSLRVAHGTRFIGLAAVCGALVLGALSNATWAADSSADTGSGTAAPASEQTGALQEVVVTARRQTENLEKIPVAVEAISTEALVEQNIATESDLQAATPGLLVRAATSTNQLAFAIRGQALDAFSYTSPTVLTYFDEVQTGGVSSTTLYDLQSVQVLKGPQGTLFGRNATGGAVLYTTTQPGKELTGYIDVTGGNYDDRKVEGAVTVPFADWASFRLAGEIEKRDGYEHNIYLGVDEASIDNKNVRGTLLLTPTDALQNTTTYQYGSQGGYSGGMKITSVNTPTNSACALAPPAPSCAGWGLYPAGVPGTGGYNPALLKSYNGLLNFLAYQATQPFYNIYDISDAAHNALLKEGVNKTTYALSDDLSIKNIAGYNRVNTHDQTDVVGSPFGLLPISPQLDPYEGYQYSTEQYSDELQLAGDFDQKRLKYILGAYYGRDIEGQDIPLNEGCASIASGPSGGCLVPGGFRYNFITDDESRALFLQSTYEILDGFHFTAGYRQSWDVISFAYNHDSEPQDAHFLGGTPVPPPLSERKPSWTLGLDYQLNPETLIYLTQRGGFRVGGYNGTSSIPTASGGTAIDTFRPETAVDLELGAKFSGRVFDLPARLNMDVYEERLRDAQRVVYFGISSQTTNAAKAQVDGFEMDALLDLTSWLEWGANFAYTNARYTDGSAPFVAISILTGKIEVGDVTLGPYGDTPKVSGSMYLRVSEALPNGLGKLVLRADVFAQSYFYYTNLAASLPQPLDANTKIGGYGLLNARVEWNDIAGSRIHVAGWVKNALNREYEVGGLGLGAVVGTDAVILGTPRMFGAEVGVKF